MKRSKIFLGLTTGVLAVVAFTAAKSAKFSHKVQGYITGSSGLRCTLAANANPYYTVGGPNVAKTAVNGQKTIFEYKQGTCASPLFTVQSGD